TMKLWDKGTDMNKLIEGFTIDKDPELDMHLAVFDILGSIAQSKMLHHIGLLTLDELNLITAELQNIFRDVKNGKFIIEEGVEDVHTQVELILTRKLGDTGKKIHSGRSRNDQILLDIRLFIRNKLQEIVDLVSNLFDTLINLSEKYKDYLIPGYTHLQVAMPSSFGLWFGAYAESLTDDLQLLHAVYQINNQNPLGSAAGYGSSFPLNRQMTTDLLGFDRMNLNVIYAQMGRGKIERLVSFAFSSLAATVSKMSTDLCLFMSQNFNFVSLPDEFIAGSSIMPHKKNPDVFELLRAKCNRIQSLPNEITIIMNNLPTGYFRDMQMIKEPFLHSFFNMKNCLKILPFILNQLIINPSVLKDEKYKYLFSVEEVNKLVLKGIPFREAYLKIAEAIRNGTYEPSGELRHTHEGSLGNLCNNKIKEKMDQIMSGFNFEKAEKALSKLLK
ncbi:MAG TPA: argininosuccinate lyase, partial [Bacteroidales bacterium]|nr:argininosuccinate lyase [Bacteroidales bacterium]